VSPQYHCWNDDFFESVDSQDISVSTNWQQLAGLTTSSLRELSSDPAPPSQPQSNQDDQPSLHPAANKLPHGPDDSPQVEPQASKRFAGVISRGKTRTMTQAMEDSIEKQCLFFQQDRDHTSFKAVPGKNFGESAEDC
jgi:hypothetical protein